MNRKHSPLMWLMLALALLGCTALLIPRILSEEGDRSCAIALFQEDLSLLASENGMEEAEFLEALGAGTVYVIGSDGIGYAPDGSPAFASGATVELMEGAATEDAAARLLEVTQKDLPLLLIENKHHTGMHTPPGFDADSYEGEVLRGHYLFLGYRNRLSEGSTEAISQLLFLSASDRGLRLFILRPFGDKLSGEVCTELEVYRQCMEEFSALLEARGLSLGRGFSTADTEALNPLLLACAGMAPALAAAWLLLRLKKLRPLRTPLLLAAITADFALCFLLPALAQKGLMLAASIVLPWVFFCFLSSLAKEAPPRLQKLPFLPAALALMAAVLGAGLLSGLAVAALMSSRAYLLSADIFTGVKLSLLLPMAVGWLLLVIKIGKKLLPRDTKSALSLIAVVLVAGAIALGLLLRSGDVSQLSDFEAAIRGWLEKSLYARPRTKELLLAAPCVPVFLWAIRKNNPWLKLLAGLGVSLEVVSVCNTFCHAVAALRVSLVRALLGGAFGFLLGLAVCGILQLVFLLFFNEKHTTKGNKELP